MKQLLVAAIVALISPGVHAQDHRVQCPGESTMEMRYCAGLSLEQSTGHLKRKVPKTLLQQWQAATRAVCAHANALYKDGTVYPQVVIGCGDRLNRALLKEFQPLNSLGDPERAP